MLDVVRKRVAERRLAEQNQLGEALVIDGAIPPFQLSIQVRTSRGKRQRLDLLHVQAMCVGRMAARPPRPAEEETLAPARQITATPTVAVAVAVRPRVAPDAPSQSVVAPRLAMRIRL
jgi:hypothetical protein